MLDLAKMHLSIPCLWFKWLILYKRFYIDGIIHDNNAPINLTRLDYPKPSEV